MDYRRSAAPNAVELIPTDLAPGDAAAVELDWSGLRVERIRSREHGLFRTAYDRLWREFGAAGEIEREAVLASRFAWDPGQRINDYALLYEMLAVSRNDQIVGLRDHTAIVPLRADGDRGRGRGPIVVHLSHNLVEAPLRGSGLAGWLRAFPIQTARECAARAGASHGVGITLVAEMEAFDPSSPATATRLRSYERAGFLTIDPDTLDYHQPDFRDVAEITRSSVQSLPLMLTIRRVGREAERRLPAAELRGITDALYTMFSEHISVEHMSPLWAMLDRHTGRTQDLALVSPLAARRT